MNDRYIVPEDYITIVDPVAKVDVNDIRPDSNDRAGLSYTINGKSQVIIDINEPNTRGTSLMVRKVRVSSDTLQTVRIYKKESDSDAWTDVFNTPVHIGDGDIVLPNGDKMSQIRVVPEEILKFSDEYSFAIDLNVCVGPYGK